MGNTGIVKTWQILGITQEEYNKQLITCKLEWNKEKAEREKEKSEIELQDAIDTANWNKKKRWIDVTWSVVFAGFMIYIIVTGINSIFHWF
jgi:hypothetical protein